MNKHLLEVSQVIQHGQEELLLAEKTWPLPIPEKTRLVAILISKYFWGNSSLEVAIDVTEPARYEMYLNQLWNGKWSSIRMFYLPENKLDLCRKTPPA
ncbi:MAG: hypothetical protein IT577_24590 [Verrucomicrobiae bacterium]|nr:hypothetical protein [Verrucomicrobiae bacterium]